MRYRLLPSLVLLPGCLVPDALVDRYLDRDNDGERTVEIGGPDCDDDDPRVNSTQVERCGNGVDDDCDGRIDDDGLNEVRWYFDGDGDGFGDPAVEVFACAQPEHYVPDATDCDDSNARISPAAAEVCGDGLDNNCGPEASDDLLLPWHLDRDGDGAGGPTVWLGCEPPPGYVVNGDDCDDADPDAAPGLPERCDGADNDCDGASESAPTPCYADADADGHGDPSTPLDVCDGGCPAGTVGTADDCDDASATIFPGAPELCGDGVTNDCARAGDPEAVPLWFVDLDGDGFGGGSPVAACNPPPGHVADGRDCDDAEPAVHPHAVERCGNSVDDDCDGRFDDGAPISWFLDADGDGVGGDAASSSCEAPPAHTALTGDCDDLNPTRWPGAEEVCNGVDDDCDGTPEPIPQACHADTDGDGFGDPAEGSPLCATACPSGFTADATDCDDDAPFVYPGAPERCGDAVVNDCRLPPGPDVVPAWYVDADGDGVGAGPPITACVAPAGHVAASGDCDDRDASTHPGAPDVCDDVDNDCDRSNDLPATACYADADDDGHGAGARVGWACDAPCPTGTAAGDQDCDDNAADVHPAATEVCGDGVDQDCAGPSCGLRGRWEWGSPIMNYLTTTGAVPFPYLLAASFYADGNETWVVHGAQRLTPPPQPGDLPGGRQVVAEILSYDGTVLRRRSRHPLNGGEWVLRFCNVRGTGAPELIMASPEQVTVLSSAALTTTSLNAPAAADVTLSLETWTPPGATITLRCIPGTPRDTLVVQALGYLPNIPDGFAEYQFVDDLDTITSPAVGIPIEAVSRGTLTDHLPAGWSGPLTASWVSVTGPESVPLRLLDAEPEGNITRTINMLPTTRAAIGDYPISSTPLPEYNVAASSAFRDWRGEVHGANYLMEPFSLRYVRGGEDTFLASANLLNAGSDVMVDDVDDDDIVDIGALVTDSSLAVEYRLYSGATVSDIRQPTFAMMLPYALSPPTPLVSPSYAAILTVDLNGDGTADTLIASGDGTTLTTRYAWRLSEAD